MFQYITKQFVFKAIQYTFVTHVTVKTYINSYYIEKLIENNNMDKLN